MKQIEYECSQFERIHEVKLVELELRFNVEQESPVSHAKNVHRLGGTKSVTAAGRSSHSPRWLIYTVQYSTGTKSKFIPAGQSATPRT